MNADQSTLLDACDEPQVREPQGVRLSTICLLVSLTVATLLLAIAFSGGRMSDEGARDEVQLLRASYQPAGVISKPIEQVRVGDRVVVDLPPAAAAVEPEDLSLGSGIDPATWRLIELEAPKRDGSMARVTYLRPARWLAEQDVQVGGLVPILVPECGIDGNAKVLAIQPCPSIAPPAPDQGTDGCCGPPATQSRLVTGIFRHVAAWTIDVYVEGLAAPIGATGNHPFWSEDRSEFVRADSLQVGERLHSLSGTPRVLRIEPRGDPESVYNLEIQGRHVYHVGDGGILVHNALGSLNVLGDKCPRPFGNKNQDELVKLIEKYEKDADRMSVGNHARYERYLRKKEAAKKKPMNYDEWFDSSRGQRQGGPDHQTIQNRLRDDLGAKTETPIAGRFADAVEFDSTGNPKVIHQIGGVNKRGDPISRERLAIEEMVEDLKARPGEYGDVEIVIWDKTKPGAKTPAMRFKLSEFPPPGWDGD